MSDAFTWDFDRLVWANMRRRIRALGPDSFWYRFLQALLLVISERASRASWIYRQLRFETSDGIGLVLWGQRYRIPQMYAETPDAYKQRIAEERMHMRSPTNAARKSIMASVLGVDIADVSIRRVYDYHWTVGGVVGAPIGSRDYAMTGLHIYAPKPGVADLAERGARARRLIDRANVGSNWPEIYLDEGPAAVIDVHATQGRRLDADPTDPIHQFTHF